MNNNSSLARWCGYAGLIGIALSIASGLMGLMNPADAYSANPTDVFNYTTSVGRFVLVIEGLAGLVFTAAFFGYYLVAAGNGMLGKIANVLSVIGGLGWGIGFILGAFSGAESPLIYVSFLILPGWILLTVAALRAKQVSTLKAWVPVIIMVIVFAIEMGLPMNGIVDIVHQAVYGSISFVVLSQVGNLKLATA